MRGNQRVHRQLRIVKELVPAQVPRRFPIGTLLLLMAVFAVLLSALRTAGAHPAAIVFVAGFTLVVGLGQILLYHGNKPREASMMAGVVGWVIMSIIVLVASAVSGVRSPEFSGMVCLLLFGVFCAAPLGYITGCVLAGVFLVVNRARTGQWNQVREVEPPILAKIVDEPDVRIAALQPVLETLRLRLRPLTLSDAPDVQRLAGDADVASTLARMPHPYEDGMAETWISARQEEYRAAEEVVFAIVRKEEDRLVGSVGLRLTLDQAKGELGYWIGKPYWNQGYATEAAREVLRYGFEQLGLVTIFAHHMVRNPASGRVMQKIGMTHVGRVAAYIEKNGVQEDVEAYEMMRYQFEESDQA